MFIFLKKKTYYAITKKKKITNLEKTNKNKNLTHFDVMILSDPLNSRKLLIQN